MLLRVERAWIYNKTEEPKIVLKSEAEAYYADGWADSPAKFMTEGGLKGAEKIPIEMQVSAIDGVKEAMNGALNLKLMTKRELAEFSAKHCGLDFKDTKKIKHSDMLEQIEAAMGLDDDDNTDEITREGLL